MLVIIRGAGDIATGIALRLHRSGYRLILTDLPALEAVEIGCSAFTSLSTLSVSSTAACVPSRVDLPNLLTFTAGYGSCYGGCKHGMGQLNVYFGSRRADGV